MRIAVNVSPLQLRNRGFVAEIEQAIGVDAQAAGGLELEITESLIMEDVKHNIASLQAIRALGVTTPSTTSAQASPRSPSSPGCRWTRSKSTVPS
ncbi:MAG: hypothetical protein M3O07_04515 [Pseudomonadota bacterium]|nr:hypothetical protein [Pseudomonadota bacterium]